MALSAKDSAAVKKAAQAGGLSASAGSQIVSATNAGKTINAGTSTPNNTAVASAPTGFPGGRDPIRAENTPAGTKFAGDPSVPAPTTPTTPDQIAAAARTNAQQDTPQMPGQDTITDPLTGASFTKSAPNGTYAPTPNKYQQGLSTLQGGGAAPQEAGAARGSVADALPQQQDTSAVDSYISTDPNVNTLMQGITQLLNPQQQTTSLMDDYNELYKQSGLDDINHELIDTDTVINGTEQNIRDEIQTAGGFGTDSQIQAMALSRNKGLLTRYNQLVQMKTDATNQLNTLSQLNAQDKQMAQQRLNTQIDSMFKLGNFVQQSQNNVRESFNAIVSKVGFSGAYAAYANSPQQLSYINNIMGLGDGGLEALAKLPPSPEEQLDTQYKKAQIANIYSQINERNNPVNAEGTLSGKPQNAVQAQANGYADRLVQADKIIGSVGNEFTSTLSAIGGVLPNFLKSSDRQSYEQAQKNFVNAVLRQESGASIAPAEFASAQQQYFPQPGDKPEVVSQKADNRNTAINNLYRQANISRPVYPGMVVQSGGKNYKVGDDGETLQPI